MTLKFDGWPWKTIGHLFNATPSFVHHFVAIGEFKLELQSGNAQSGSIWRFLEPCDLDIWRMSLKNNRAPFLSKIKLYASFHHHMWIQTGVTVRKRLSGVVTSVTLTFDLWPWPFAWTSPLSLVITPEHYVMIRWWSHSEKGVTDRQTDGRKRPFIEQCDLETWRMTLNYNRAPLLSIIKLYASLHHHMWIQTGVTVRKRLSLVVTTVNLTFDLWPWPSAWTSLLS